MELATNQKIAPGAANAKGQKHATNVGDPRSRPAFSKHSHQPRPFAGRDVAALGGNRIVLVRSPSTVLIHRWRSPRKPGPMVADVSIAMPGERIAFVSNPEELLLVIA